MNSNSPETQSDDVALPSLRALETAAIKHLSAMVQGSRVKPSAEAMQIAARILARRAQIEVHAKQSASVDGLPNLDTRRGAVCL